MVVRVVGLLLGCTSQESAWGIPEEFWELESKNVRQHIPNANFAGVKVTQEG